MSAPLHAPAHHAHVRDHLDKVKQHHKERVKALAAAAEVATERAAEQRAARAQPAEVQA